jgi:6,7-dimethyl-8-ribityllumazine synthase
MKSISGELKAQGCTFAVVSAQFNSFMTEHLHVGAVETLKKLGAADNDITLVQVPGAFEIPVVCKKLAESGKYDAIISVGAVIRGSTSHYDHVCAEVAKGISHVMLSTGVPVMFGVITTDTIEQAIERSGCKAGNKGAEAAMAAVEMVNVLKALD